MLADEERTSNGKVKLIRIPGGTFTMGSPADEPARGDDEGPQQQNLRVASFLLGETEVTRKQYASFLHANPTVPNPLNWGQYRPDERLDWPVLGVAWQDAVRFAQWDGARLPTEAEWEYAARGRTSESRYGAVNDIAWYADNSNSDIHPVATKKPNAFGLYDMLGNAEEWTSDFYTASYGDVADRAGRHVARGGSFYSPVEVQDGKVVRDGVRAAARLPEQPTGIPLTGFRIARSR